MPEGCDSFSDESQHSLKTCYEREAHASHSSGLVRDGRDLSALRSISCRIAAVHRTRRRVLHGSGRRHDHSAPPSSTGASMRPTPRPASDGTFLIPAPCGVCQERLRYWGPHVEVAVPTGHGPTAW